MNALSCRTSSSALAHGPLSMPGRQRGAVALFSAICLIGILAAIGFSIDLAQLYYAKHSLQKQANLSALNAARAAGGCLAPDDPRGRQSIATQSALDTIQALGGKSSWLADGVVNLGHLNVDNEKLRSFRPALDEEAAKAQSFEVRLQRPLPKLFFPIPAPPSEERFIYARATSTMSPTASYRVGSTLLHVGSGDVALLNALLTVLLGENPHLDVLGTQGLLSSSVNLLGLTQQTGNEDVFGLLNIPIPLPDILQAITAELLDSGEAVAAAAVDQILAVAPDIDVLPGSSIPSSDDVIYGVGNTVVNTLDLVQSLVMQLGGPSIKLSPDISVPGVAEVSAHIELAGPMELGVGPALQNRLGSYLTRASSAAAELELEVRLLPLLGDTVALNLEIDIADSQAELLEIRCPGRGRQQAEVVLGIDSGVASIRLNNDGISGPPLVNLLGLIQICASSAPVPGRSAGYQNQAFQGPFDPNDPVLLEQNTAVLGAGVGTQVSHLLSDVINGTQVQFCPGSPTGPLLNVLLTPVLSLLGLGNANGLLDLVEGLLSGVLGGIVDPIVEPLLAALGVDLLATTVTVLDVYTPPPTLLETY